jgi:hypothetical protein
MAYNNRIYIMENPLSNSGRMGHGCINITSALDIHSFNVTAFAVGTYQSSPVAFEAK